MYFFDKKTMYLVWNMQEGQARGVGTVKFLAMDEICRIEVAITGCGKVQGTYPVYILSGDMQSLLGEITLSKGKGNLYIKCSTGKLGHKAFPYNQVTGMRVDLKTEGYLEQKWLPMQEKETVVKKENNRMVDREQGGGESRAEDRRESRAESRKEARTGESRAESRKEARTGENRAESRKEARMGERGADREESREQVERREWDVQKEKKASNQIKKASDEVKPPEKNTMSLYSNKWQQLCAIYPVVHPFQDGRAYLSIEPRDFVVLQERYQPMVQNSFLLHGFYHYRHLLLGRHQQGKNVQYYLGVPGVFYEKEKAAALFYGFESFEGPVTPAKEGSFGYYMKRVQI